MSGFCSSSRPLGLAILARDHLSGFNGWLATRKQLPENVSVMAVIVPEAELRQMKRRRGVEMRLIIKGNGAPVRREDLALLKAAARAHEWVE
jgi:hypothetical protein